MTDKPFDIGRFFEGHLSQLQVEAEYFSDNIHHNAEKGRQNETHFVSMLRRYLPQRFGIGTGFIASVNPDQHRSPQCDVIIYDAVNNTPLYTSPAFSVFPIEMVYGVIEIKTTLNGAELASSLKNCDKIRKMAKQYVEHDKPVSVHAFRYADADAGCEVELYKSYQRSQMINGKPEATVFYHPLAPRFFIFAYNGWVGADTLLTNFKDKTQEHPDAHVHGLCVLNGDGGFYTRHIPHKTPSKRVHPIQSTGGLSELVLTLPWLLDGMLPPHPHRAGNGFDLIDLTRYDVLRTTLPVQTNENFVTAGKADSEGQKAGS